MPAVARFRSVVVDCPDPRELARFYAQVGGGTPEDDDPDWVVLRIPDGPRLAFQRSPGFTPPEWPRSDRNAQQFHLDFDGGSTWEEIDAAEERCCHWGRGCWTGRTTRRRTSGCTPTRRGIRSACAGSSTPPESPARHPSSSEMVAADGSRRCWAARAVKSAPRSTRWTFPQVRRATSASSQPRRSNSAISRG